MKKVDLDTFLEDDNIKIEVSYMDYRIYRDKSNGRLGVINIKTSELQYDAIFDRMIDDPRGGHLFLKQTNSNIWYVLTKHRGAVLIPEAKDLQRISHLRGSYYAFFVSCWGIVDADNGVCVVMTKYDSIEHNSSALHDLRIGGKRLAIFDDKSGELFTLKDH